jgi:NAD(P)-dependent dehydrogenase (short-subunit alcohol dehydrogenase family)
MSARTVLITGSSSGIGKAAAEEFSARGWNVSATMRSPGSAAVLKAGAGTIITPRLDVTDRASIDRAVRETVDRFGSIDVVVNNAGYMLMGPLEAWPEEGLEEQFSTNFFGAVNVIRAALPVMRKAGGGTVINVSSIGGRIGFPLGSAYHASKFALEGLSDSLRYELRPLNIRVKVVEPGGIRTDFVKRGLQWTEHPVYGLTARPMRRLMGEVDRFAPGPEAVARTIFRAAVDSSGKLRYPAKPGPFLFLHNWLPDVAWRSMLYGTLAWFRRPVEASTDVSSVA